eukprot:CAMPEP_0172370536 /NCGR_PEP_ID=MMETSP1060-20121228/38106_1 /TAXON_ID=37318 /ORGANISM="Pseudo-nitzschia pungens, Strain cf. cingulata" /LENGTH=215 /DNA_ID=CAMNT_0013095829 /DNA_START=83 /DNA_END=730 /DNA_ORIENTATION=+
MMILSRTTITALLLLGTMFLACASSASPTAHLRSPSRNSQPIATQSAVRRPDGPNEEEYIPRDQVQTIPPEQNQRRAKGPGNKSGSGSSSSSGGSNSSSSSSSSSGGSGSGSGSSSSSSSSSGGSSSSSTTETVESRISVSSVPRWHDLTLLGGDKPSASIVVALFAMGACLLLLISATAILTYKTYTNYHETREKPVVSAEDDKTVQLVNESLD